MGVDHCDADPCDQQPSVRLVLLDHDDPNDRRTTDLCPDHVDAVEAVMAFLDVELVRRG